MRASALFLAVCVAAGLSACSRAPAPSQVETQAPDDVIDDPSGQLGLVEPRVVVLPAPDITASPTPLSATTDVIYEPSTERSVSTVREAILRISVSGVKDPSELQLELDHPAGGAYESRVATVGGVAGSSYVVDFIFPVAGTPIDRANLSGVWTAHYLLRGQPLADQTFQLDP